MLIRGIPLQEKIAELERRIVALEEAQKKRANYTTTTTTTQGPLTDAQTGHWNQMWGHFDSVFSELGKIFR